MADRPASPGQQRQSRTATPAPVAAATSFLAKLQEQAATSSHLMGFLTLAISGGILLLLSGFTLTVTFLGLIFLTPLIIFTSPIWFPIAAILFFIVAGVLSVGGFGAASVAVLSWLYRYMRGFHPPGSDRVDYARSRIADTASHMKDYAREYGGYLQSKVKDAAPGA